MLRKLTAFALAMLTATPAFACNRPGMDELYRAVIIGGERSYSEPVPMAFPNFSYIDESGQRKTLEDHKGKAMIVTFWHPDCAGCKIDLPRLDDHLANAKGIDTSQFVQISLQTLNEGPYNRSVSLGEVKEFLDGKSYNEIKGNYDPENAMFNASCLVATPSHLMINSEGKVTDVLFGPLRWSEPPFADIAKNYLANY